MTATKFDVWEDNRADKQYAALVSACLVDGDRVRTRNSDVRRVTAHTLKFTSTPLIGVRKTSWKLALREMEWVLSGSNNINDLHPSVHHWWKPWASASGEIYFNYGEQLRRFTAVDPRTGYLGQYDQVGELVKNLRDHPNSRRLVMTTWNPAEMNHPDCPITNCWGSIIQVFSYGDRYLELVTYQRSVDVVCGLPHNLIQMWAFMKWLASRTGMGVGRLKWIGGDCHVYSDHYELAEKILDNTHNCKPTPTLCYNPTSEEFKADDFSLDIQYEPVLTETAVMVV